MIGGEMFIIGSNRTKAQNNFTGVVVVLLFGQRRVDLEPNQTSTIEFFHDNS